MDIRNLKVIFFLLVFTCCSEDPSKPSISAFDMASYVRAEGMATFSRMESLLNDVIESPDGSDLCEKLDKARQEFRANIGKYGIHPNAIIVRHDTYSAEDVAKDQAERIAWDYDRGFDEISERCWWAVKGRNNNASHNDANRNDPSHNNASCRPATPDLVTVTGSLEGAVKKIKGVSVAIHLSQNGNAVASIAADADGNYRIDKIAPGTYTVTIIAHGYEAVEQTIQINADGVASLDKVMLKMLEIPAARIRGAIFNRQNRSPINEVRVRLVDASGNSREVLTTQTGAFEFKNVPTDQQLTITIDCGGYEKQEFTVDPIPVGETVKLEVELIPLNPE